VAEPAAISKKLLYIFAGSADYPKAANDLGWKMIPKARSFRRSPTGSSAAWRTIVPSVRPHLERFANAGIERGKNVENGRHKAFTSRHLIEGLKQPKKLHLDGTFVRPTRTRLRTIFRLRPKFGSRRCKRSKAV
jgi:hypothetical protein